MYAGVWSAPVSWRASLSMTLPHLVAYTTWSRVCSKVSPNSSSACPVPYASEVSNRVTPSSTARRSARTDSASSVGPQPSAWSPAQNGPPSAQVPKPMAATSTPELPMARFSIVLSLQQFDDLAFASASGAEKSLWPPSLGQRHPYRPHPIATVSVRQNLTEIISVAIHRFPFPRYE